MGGFTGCEGPTAERREKIKLREGGEEKKSGANPSRYQIKGEGRKNYYQNTTEGA